MSYRKEILSLKQRKSQRNNRASSHCYQVGLQTGARAAIVITWSFRFSKAFLFNTIPSPHSHFPTQETKSTAPHQITAASSTPEFRSQPLLFLAAYSLQSEPNHIYPWLRTNGSA